MNNIYTYDPTFTITDLVDNVVFSDRTIEGVYAKLLAAYHALPIFINGHIPRSSEYISQNNPYTFFGLSFPDVFVFCLIVICRSFKHWNRIQLRSIWRFLLILKVGFSFFVDSLEPTLASPSLNSNITSIIFC